METLEWTWQERPRPLLPVAVAGVDEAGLRLARRLLEEPDERLQALQAAGGTSECFLLVVSTSAELLPWADGVQYLGRDTAAPAILIPTNRVPTVPLALLERGLRTQLPELAPPLAVVPVGDTMRVFSASAARTVSRRVVQAWLKAWEAARRR